MSFAFLRGEQSIEKARGGGKTKQREYFLGVFVMKDEGIFRLRLSLSNTMQGFGENVEGRGEGVRLDRARCTNNNLRALGSGEEGGVLQRGSEQYECWVDTST